MTMFGCRGRYGIHMSLDRFVLFLERYNSTMRVWPAVEGGVLVDFSLAFILSVNDAR
jgi:hypothetical protein